MSHPNCPSLIFKEDAKTLKGGNVVDLVHYLIDINYNTELIEKFLAAAPHVIEVTEIWEALQNKFTQAPNDAARNEKVLGFIWLWIEKELMRDFLSLSSLRTGGGPSDRPNAIQRTNSTTDFFVQSSKQTVLYNQLLAFLKTLSKDQSNKYKLLILKTFSARKKKYGRKLKLGAMENSRVRSFGTANTGTSITPPSPPLTPSRQSPSNTVSEESTRLSLSAPSSPSLGNRLQSGGGLKLGGSSNSNNNNNNNNNSGSLSVTALTLSSDNLPALEPGKFTFLDVEPAHIAEQLTLLEYDMFKDILDSELVNLNWKKSHSKLIAANVIRMVEKSTQVSFWVATEIVNQTELKQRVSVIKRFILVAERFKELNNLNGLMEIIGGLSLYQVQRLRRTWDEVPARFTQSLKDLETIMDPIQNYKNYRTLLKQTPPPAIPYLGITLRDIVFVDEGNPNFLETKTEPNVSSKVINFEKLTLMGDIIIDMRRFQDNPPNLHISDVLLDYLGKLNYLPEELLDRVSVTVDAREKAESS